MVFWIPKGGVAANWSAKPFLGKESSTGEMKRDDGGDQGDQMLL
jgi:hypothetical protein